MELRQVVNDAGLAQANGEPYTIDDEIGGVLQLGVMKWFYDTDKAEDVINGLTHARGAYNSVASALTSADTATEYHPQQQILYHPQSLTIDVGNNYHWEYPIDDDTSADAARKQIIGHDGSAQEHAIWEELICVESISTIKSFQLAREGGD